MRQTTQYKRYSRSRFGNIFYFSILFFAGAFTTLPMIYTILTSFKPLDELLVFPPRFLVYRPTILNYVTLPTVLSNLKIPISRYLFNSVLTTLVTTVLQVIVSSMAAFALSKTNLKGRKIIFLIVQFALLYNSYTLAIPHYIIFSKLQLINSYAIYILPHLQSALGVFLIKQFMDDSIPTALLEAAKIDGANHGTIFWSIVFPNIKPAWLTLFLFAFREIWSLTPSGVIFDEQLKTFPMVMSQISSGGLARAGCTMAATTLLMIPPTLVYLLTQSRVIETMSSAGIKD